jgi:hypothetical protein
MHQPTLTLPVPLLCIAISLMPQDVSIYVVIKVHSFCMYIQPYSSLSHEMGEIGMDDWYKQRGVRLEYRR